MTYVLFFIITIVTMVHLEYLDRSRTVAVLFSFLATTPLVTTMILNLSDIKRSMVAVERLARSKIIPSENETKGKGDVISPFTNGAVEYRDYSARYRSGLDNILTDVSFKIAKGCKVGIVGRTGAGKSSMTYALLRMLEPTNGDITIGGTDIAHIDLHTLRSNITVISQDPVLFDLSLRDNLDPLAEHSDAELWKVLEQVHLNEHIRNMSEGMSASHEDLSLGQKQLLSLARALLRKSKILILDETTASVDVQTDQMVQTILRTSLSDCTLITIAHRINTVIDYDRILTLDGGRVVEYGDPRALLQDHSSAFYKLVHSI